MRRLISASVLSMSCGSPERAALPTAVRRIIGGVEIAHGPPEHPLMGFRERRHEQVRKRVRIRGRSCDRARAHRSSAPAGSIPACSPERRAIGPMRRQQYPRIRSRSAVSTLLSEIEEINMAQRSSRSPGYDASARFEKFWLTPRSLPVPLAGAACIRGWPPYDERHSTGCPPGLRGETGPFPPPTRRT
jgi:hypothetical protein